jgi:hypothetical protein
VPGHDGDGEVMKGHAAQALPRWRALLDLDKA